MGSNARKAVKFLDRMTSGKEDLPHEPIVLQEPDEQYATWQEVEEHYANENLATSVITAEPAENIVKEQKQEKNKDRTSKRISGSGGPLSQLLLDKLNFGEQPTGNSPASTPPMSPVSSGPQSSKTSPEVKAAIMVPADVSPVPPTLKPLLNPVVWYMHEKKAQDQNRFFFLTNSADTQHLARDFQVPTKNIHQLRSLLGVESDETKDHAHTHRKGPSQNSVIATPNEPKTLFKYEDDDSDEEEVVFKPRGRGAGRAIISGRGSAHGSVRSKNGHTRSPRLSFSTPTQSAAPKPQIPVEEIDPNSFHRGSFGRGNTPLVNTGNHVSNQFNGFHRGPHRGTLNPNGPPRGGPSRGQGQGRSTDRGSARGRGRLFVP